MRAEMRVWHPMSSPRVPSREPTHLAEDSGHSYFGMARVIAVQGALGLAGRLAWRMAAPLGRAPSRCLVRRRQLSTDT